MVEKIRLEYATFGHEEDIGFNTYSLTFLIFIHIFLFLVTHVYIHSLIIVILLISRVLLTHYAVTR